MGLGVTNPHQATSPLCALGLIIYSQLQLLTHKLGIIIGPTHGLLGGFNELMHIQRVTK